MTEGVVAALATGLLGSFGHCLGMCGPIAGAVAVATAPVRLGPAGALGDAAAARRVVAVQIAYHAGRITTYASIGFAMGLTGSFVNTAARLAGWQDVVQVIAGALMVVLGAGALGLAGFARKLEARLSGSVFRAARGLLEGGGAGRVYPLGLLLGFLPCGLSYSAFMAAAATASPVAGLSIALAFGVGTAPALIVGGALAGAIGPAIRGALYRAGGALVVVFGLRFLLRGLGVAVP